MNTDIILIVLALLPVIVLGVYVYRSDRYEKEPLRMLFKAFFFGCLSVIPAVILELMLGAFAPSGPLFGVYNGFVVAGCSEELSKILLLSWAVWKSRDFNEYFDGIVYACFVSLGFAAVENFMYVFQSGSFAIALTTGAMRAVLSVPGHFLFGVAMGYFFALAKFRPAERRRNLMLAFLVPMLMHGTFDSLLMIPESMGEAETALSIILFVVFIVFDIFLWKKGIKRLRHLQELSREQHVGYDRQDIHSDGVKPLSEMKWDV